MRFENLKHWLLKYERRLSSGALIFGFMFDSLTLTRIDLLYENLVLIFYLFVAGASIVLLRIIQEKGLSGRVFGNVKHALPISLQFAFGGLFSGFFIFYTRSASLEASWPFLLVLLGLLVGNELFRDRYQRFSFQVSIFYFALFSYLIFFIPIMVKDIGAHVFVLSGLISILAIATIIRVLGSVLPDRVEQSKSALTVSITGIFVAINALYFANIIPPIPLSLKDAGVYHSVARTGAGDYIVEGERSHWYDIFDLRKDIHIHTGDPVYMFSSVFAPTDLKTRIFHHWQYYDTEREKWTTSTRTGFSIEGGRDGGYRGYTLKASVFPGLWRVDIETAQGQLIGREVFEIQEVAKRPKLETIIR